MARKIPYSTNKPKIMIVSRPANTFAVEVRFLLCPNEPAQAAGPANCAKHQFRGDQGTPGKGPTHFQAGQDTGKCAGHQNAQDEGSLRESVTLSHHPQCRTDSREAGMRVEGDRPQYGMNQNKDKLPLPSPNQIMASGSSAIDGRGLNIAVSVSRRSAPTRVMLANAVSSPARSRPATYPLRTA